MTSTLNASLKNAILLKLSIVTKGDGESMLRAVWYLAHEEELFNNKPTSPPCWATLRSLLYLDTVFTKFTERMIEETKKAELDNFFRRTSNFIHRQMKNAQDERSPYEVQQTFDVAQIKYDTTEEISGLSGIAYAWNVLPGATKMEIQNAISNIGLNRDTSVVVHDYFMKAEGAIVTAALAVTGLCADAILSLSRWWKGEITGKRCGKKMVDSIVTIFVAGVAGVIAATTLGFRYGPIGTIICASAAACLFGIFTNQLSDKFTQSLFGIPKDQALEKAYNFFGVCMYASNAEINSSFKNLCLKHHPDKEGKPENFLKVQINMAVIKLHRGELFNEIREQP